MPVPDANSASPAPAAPRPSDPGDLPPPSSAFERLEALTPPGAATSTTTSPSAAFDGTPAYPNTTPGSELPAPEPTPVTTAPAASSAQLTRRGRVRKWDRPKQPMDWRFWVGGTGKVLIATGLLMFGFVAYQLWGTGIETARAQNALENEFEALLAEAPAITVDGGAPTAPDTTIAVDAGGGADPDTDPGGTDPGEASPLEGTPPEPAGTLTPIPIEQQVLPPDLENGEALARLIIPRIGRSDIVVAGVGKNDLKRGPGHFPDTPLPGQLGNSAIAGHRTTYGEPFLNIDNMEIGDEIIAETLSGTFTYRVTGQQIVASTDYWVVATEDPNRATLTLVSCHPKYTAQQRIIIFSELVSSESSPVGEPIINYGRPEEPATDDESDDVVAEPDATGELPGEPDAVATDDDPLSTPTDGDTTLDSDDVVVVDEPTELTPGQVSTEVVDAFSGGWFSDPAANVHVGLWGALLALVGLGSYLVSRKLRRDWAGALVGIVPFVVVLYFFFQNVNRLLPTGL